MNMLHLNRVMILAVLLACFAMALPATAVAEEKVWTSGTHGLNQHVIPAHNPSTEVISGKISETSSSGIYMDGEFFPLVGAEIMDDKYRPAEIKDLYVGLAVKVFKKHGGVRKLLCIDMIRTSSTGTAGDAPVPGKR